MPWPVACKPSLGLIEKVTGRRPGPGASRRVITPVVATITAPIGGGDSYANQPLVRGSGMVR